MAHSSYLEFLLNQPEKKFMKTIDLVYIYKETEEKINNLNIDLNNVNQNISNLQQQLKTANKESKQSIVTEIKNLGTKKNEIKDEINNLSTEINGRDGYRSMISRLGNDPGFNNVISGTGFVDYVCNTAINILEIKNRFIALMPKNYEYPYLSNYAKNLSRNISLDERSSNIFERVEHLPSFRSRNSRDVDSVLGIDLVNDNIHSYLKRKGGKRRKTRHNKKRKSRRKNYSRKNK